MTFEEILDQAVAMLQRRGRMTYRTLQLQFKLDDEMLEALKEELLYSQPQVVDDEGKGLMWTGEVETKPASTSTQPVQQEGTQQNQPSQTSPPPAEPRPREAERRQLTVMFCDLVDSTKLSSQLEFWSAFVEYGKSMRSTVSFRKPRPQHWYSLAIGRSRFNLSLTVNTRQHRIGCELYIRHPQYSKKAFALLFAQKDAIESELGPLDWQELPHRRDCRTLNIAPTILTIAPSGRNSTHGCWNACRRFVASLLIVCEP
jgi:hypothetical protein